MKSTARHIALVACLAMLAAGVSAQDKSPRKTSDGRFTIESEVARLPVISQGSTGTCWSFATISFLEAEMERIHEKPMNLSELFPVYYTYLEKSRRFVRLHGKAQFSEGGLCHDVIAMVKHHGIVPADRYTGLDEGENRHDHSEMAGLLETVVGKLAEMKKPSRHWEGAIRGILDAYIGNVPEEFEFEGRTITPKQYADDVLKIPYDDYVSVMSFAYVPFWERGELMVPDNWMRYQDYANVPIDAMMEGLDHAVRKGYSVAVDMDVSERGKFEAGKGVAKLSRRLERDGAVTDELRQAQFDSRETTDDHLMHVVGVAKDEKGRTWYMTKNSWGPIGPYEGYVFMSRNYVALKMLSFMVHQDGLPPEMLKKVSP